MAMYAYCVYHAMSKKSKTTAKLSKLHHATICTRHKFAYMAITSTIDDQHLLQYLDNLQYGKENGNLKLFSLHPDKCNVLSFTRNKNPNKFYYTLHGHPLESLEETKYCGLTIRQDLKWINHVNNVCMKANATLGFLHRNLNISSIAVKEQAFPSLMRL